MPDWLMRVYYRYQSHIVVISTVAILLGYALFRNPDANFRSADGNWADGEISFKGRDFESVVWYFEEYKANCLVPDAVLLRTTPRNWLNVYAWPSYLTEKKWRVPYGEALQSIGGYYPPANDGTHCYNSPLGPASDDDRDLKVRQYLDQL